jgi:hypothetical protein
VNVANALRIANADADADASKKKNKSTVLKILAKQKFLAIFVFFDIIAKHD